MTKLRAFAQVVYSFPLGTEGQQTVEIAVWDGSEQQAVVSQPLRVVPDVGTADAAHSTIEGDGLNGAVAGQAGWPDRHRV